MISLSNHKMVFMHQWIWAFGFSTSRDKFQMRYEHKYQLTNERCFIVDFMITFLSNASIKIDIYRLGISQILLNRFFS